jgi:hypothetical protein
MQIVKQTGWTLDYICNTFDIKEIYKMSIWAFNQEIVERENTFAIMQWHLGIQHKKSSKTAKKNLKKAITRKSYNPEKDKTADWNNLFRAYNPKGFDKFINSLKPANNS